MLNRKIILASGSPRRKELLEQIGLKFEIVESGYEEDMGMISDPYGLVKFLALKKAENVAEQNEDAIIISADTFVVLDGEFIGKPKNREEAEELLKRLSGKIHEVVSGFAIIDTKDNNIINDFGKAKVKFRALDDTEIKEYVATGEPLDKAGGYAIQNKASVFIESIEGDYYSIVGLPLAKVYLELKNMGVNGLW
jgi:septum formation protein